MKSSGKFVFGFFLQVAFMAGLILSVNVGTAIAASLPGNADALNEQYGDWNVVCRKQKSDRVCAMLHRRNDAKSGKQVFAMELRVTADGVTGSMVLPFGLSMRHGVRLKIDDADPMTAMPFKTCLPVGCIVPVAFDSEALKALTQGKVLNVQAKQANDESNIVIPASLLGMGNALNRIMDLSK